RGSAMTQPRTTRSVRAAPGSPLLSASGRRPRPRIVGCVFSPDPPEHPWSRAVGRLIFVQRVPRVGDVQRRSFVTTTPVPPVDVDLLREEIRKTYAAVSQEPEREFIFPTGRSWAEDLDYPAELANVPESSVKSFAGVANPFSLGRIKPGEHVLDLGSGAGTDSLVAAQ